jgi:hypothetical protein
MTGTAAGYDVVVSPVTIENPQVSGTNQPAISIAAPILPDRFSGVSSPGASPVPPELRSTSSPNQPTSR